MSLKSFKSKKFILNFKLSFLQGKSKKINQPPLTSLVSVIVTGERGLTFRVCEAKENFLFKDRNDSKFVYNVDLRESYTSHHDSRHITKYSK